MKPPAEAAMATDAGGVSRIGDRKSGRRKGAGLAISVCLGALLAAGVALWSSQGAEVFLGQAFAALVACF